MYHTFCYQIITCAIALIITSLNLYAADSTTFGGKCIHFLKGRDDSPYRLHWGIDLPIVASSVSLHLLAKRIDPKYENYTAEDLIHFSSKEVNAFDRWAIGPTNINIDRASWITNAFIVNYMWLMFLGKEGRSDFTKIIAMYAEAYLMYPLAQLWTHPVFARKRPYFYSEKETNEKRLGGMAQTSFISGHVNYAFCFAVMTPILFSNYYPDSHLQYVIWPVNLGTAVATAILRVAGHYHFPTDVIGGAVTGSLVGWFVPFVHRRRDTKQQVSIAPMFFCGYSGLQLSLLITGSRP